MQEFTLASDEKGNGEKTQSIYRVGDSLLAASNFCARGVSRLLARASIPRWQREKVGFYTGPVSICGLLPHRTRSVAPLRRHVDVLRQDFASTNLPQARGAYAGERIPTASRSGQFDSLALALRREFALARRSGSVGDVGASARVKSMATDVGRANREAQRDLADLQNSYVQKRRETVQTQQQELTQLREQNRREQLALKQQNEAAINHIRRSGAESISAQKEQTETALRNQREANARQLATLQKYAAQTEGTWKERVATAQETAKENIAQTAAREEAARNKLRGNTQEFYTEQQKSINEAQNRSREEILKAVQKGETEKKATQEKYQEGLAKIEDKFRLGQQQLKTEREQTLDQGRSDLQKEVRQVQTETQKRAQELQRQGEQRIQSVQRKYKAEAERQQLQGEDSVARVQSANEERVLLEKDKGDKKVQVTRQGYEQEVAETSRVGDQRVQELKKKTQSQLETTQKEFIQRNSKIEKEYKARLEDLHSSYEKQREQNSDAYRKSLTQQSQEFQSRFRGLGQANEDSLRVQTEIFNRALALEKRNQMQELELHRERATDDFYKLQNRGTQFEDQGESYQLKAFIPAHERGRINVRIHDNKVVLSGARSFADKNVTPESKVSTNNFQTFREEFALSEPVAIRTVTETRNGDWVTFDIPKLASFAKKNV